MADLENSNIYVDAKLEIENMKKQMSELQVENSRLREIIIENELEEELEFDCTALEEKICINGIHHIAQLVEAQDYDKNDISNFQIMFNILRTVRGKATAGNKKANIKDVGKLLKIVEGENK